MLKKLFLLTIFSFVTISSVLTGEIKFEIQDIGTLQTQSSHAIMINHAGQILGWYNIDGSKEGKHHFVRDRDGNFHEIIEDQNIIYQNVPQDKMSSSIDWRYLTDAGVAYGVFELHPTSVNLFSWDKVNGIRKVGNIPSNQILTINNSGQVLIKSMVEYPNGKPLRRPAIWMNGKITSLNGLEGDLGIESDESYGLDMNNKGEVVGSSVVFLSYKDKVYKQTHATIWRDGQAIDLHDILPKTIKTEAIAINDKGEFIIFSSAHGKLLVKKDGEMISVSDKKKLNNNFFYHDTEIIDINSKERISYGHFFNTIMEDKNSIWWLIHKITKVNNSGEIIAEGETVYGEKHAMLITLS